MTHDAIFDILPAELLAQLSKTLGLDPVVTIGSAPSRLLSALSEPDQIRWLDAHRSELEDHFSFVGSSFLSYMSGNGKSYRQIVMDVADKLSSGYRTSDSTAEIEGGIIRKVWNDTVARMTPEQRQELLAQTEALATKYGVGLGKEIAGFATLTVAQMSGFGVYLLGSTLLGAINGALGLGLGFGAFTGLSSLISTVIGPVGWAALGLFTVLKLGRPNYKKLLPAIILIACGRAAGDPLVLPQPPIASTGSVTTSERSESLPQDRLKLPTGADESNEPSTSESASGKSTRTPWTSATSPANPVIRELQWEVATVTERQRSTSKQRAKSNASQVRRCSKHEKTVFDLKNRALANFSHSLIPETHYLDLEDTEKVLVNELFAHNEAMEAEAAREKQRVVQLREQNRKRERLLRHKGKVHHLDQESKTNFDREFPDLVRIANEYDNTRHYLELNKEEQEFIREWEMAERESSKLDSEELQRLSELQNAFTEAMALRTTLAPPRNGLDGEAKKLKALWAVHFPKFDFHPQPLHWCAEQQFSARVEIERALRELADAPDPVRLSRSRMHDTGEHHSRFTILDGIECRLFYRVEDGRIEVSRMCQRKDC